MRPAATEATQSSISITSRLEEKRDVESPIQDMIETIQLPCAHSQQLLYVSDAQVDVMSALEHIVYLIDDDQRVCEAVDDLLSSCGMSMVAFGSAAEYMDYTKPDLPACYSMSSSRTSTDLSCSGAWPKHNILQSFSSPATVISLPAFGP